jgi:simple sugar transport system permease protein
VTPRRIAVGGIVLAALAWFITLPPIVARTLVPSVILAVGAVAAGVYAATRDERRFGITAAALGVVAVIISAAMTGSSPHGVRSVFAWGALISSMLVFATPLLYAALGGIVCERSGVINVGLEGMMLTGAFFGIYGSDVGHSWVIGCLIAAVAGGLLALLHAWFSIHLRANQVVSGMAINFLALGITGYFFVAHYGTNGTPPNVPQIPNVTLPLVGHLGFIGVGIGSVNLLTWLGLLLVPALAWFLFRTRWGLRTRAVGEKPRAADTVGLPVLAIRYVAVVVSGMLAALGGAYLSFGFGDSFSNNMTEGRGFIALAAVIFGKWNPFGALLATLLFGFSTALAYRLPALSGTLATLFQALPYVLTLIAVAGWIGRSRGPAAAGIPYVKE